MTIDSNNDVEHTPACIVATDDELPDPRVLDTVDQLREYCDIQARTVLSRLERADMKLACAESLTGGLLADAFVRIPGASRVFLGSAVTYDIEAKASVLGVNQEILRSRGAVDPEVARQMAQLTAKLFSQTEYRARIVGLSTTGVAGPGPDGDKPAGLVFIGVSWPVFFHGVMRREDYAEMLNLQGSREIIRHRTVACVLQKLRSFTASSQE